ncbi:hypothetical protein TthTF21_02740 [Thermus thermophilus]
MEDLERGGLLLPGVHLTPAAQALAMAVNARLKAPVAYVPPLEAEPATPPGPSSRRKRLPASSGRRKAPCRA